jgi:aldose 1-epimerase
MNVQQYQLTIPHELSVTFLNYGGIIQSIRVPDRNGKMEDIVLGFDEEQKYLSPHPYFGGIIGRYANRIKSGKIEIDQKTYQLSSNEEKNCLHGGIEGFDRKYWNVKKKNDCCYQLSYTSPHLDQGFPGEVAVTVTYSVTNMREFIIEYAAWSDQNTFINLTNHSYFNLAGSGSILTHELQVDAEEIVEVDQHLIPTGHLTRCQGAFDFRETRSIGDVIPTKIEGIDYTYVLNKMGRPAATLYHPTSGRELTIFTMEPGLQIYTGHLLDGKIHGKKGDRYKKYQGLCLEPQHFPDSPHWPQFPTTLLKPNEKYFSQTIYRFGTR